MLSIARSCERARIETYPEGVKSLLDECIARSCERARIETSGMGDFHPGRWGIARSCERARIETSKKAELMLKMRGCGLKR